MRTRVQTVTQFQYATGRPKDAPAFTDRIIEKGWERYGHRYGNGVRLPNGGLLMSNAGMLQYHTPQCLPDDVGRYEAAGAVLADRLRDEARIPASTLIARATDNYGNHFSYTERYTLSGNTSDRSVTEGLLPLLVCRQRLVGPGWITPDASEFLVSAQSSFLCPAAGGFLVGTRPAIDLYRGTAVIRSGESNPRVQGTDLKAGMTALALEALSEGWAAPRPLMPADACAAYRALSTVTGGPFAFYDGAEGLAEAYGTLRAYHNEAARRFRGRDAFTDRTLDLWKRMTEAKPIESDADWAVKYRALFLDPRNRNLGSASISNASALVRLDQSCHVSNAELRLPLFSYKDAMAQIDDAAAHPPVLG